MPESRSRSRKRKAATTAAKAGGRGADRDAQSQSCAAAGEERYVPRFGSTTKRARTAGTVSNSQPMPTSSVCSDKMTGSAARSTIENGEKVEENDNKTANAAQADEEVSEGPRNIGSIDVPPITTPLASDSLTGDDSGVNSKRKVDNSNSTGDIRDVAISEVVQDIPSSQLRDSVAAVPGMSLSQFLPTRHHLPPRSPHTDCAVCDEGQSTSDQPSECGHTVQLSTPDTSLPPLTAHSQHTPPHEPTTVNTAAPISLAPCEEDPTVETRQASSITVSGDRMNLDLLDPLECSEEEEGLDETLNDSFCLGRGMEDKTIMNIHETNEDAPLISAPTHESDDVTITDSTDKKLSPDNLDDTATPPDVNITTAPLCVSHTIDLTSNDHIQNTITSADSHSRPVSVTSQHAVTPTHPATNTPLSPTLQSQVTLPLLNTSIERPTGGASMYSHSDSKMTVCSGDGSGWVCVGGSGCMEGVEDVGVVGGDNGQLRLVSSSQPPGHTKNEHSVPPAASPDELLAVREMMDLTAHDLLESQLLEEATVPSCPPGTIITSHRVVIGGTVRLPTQDGQVRMVTEGRSGCPHGDALTTSSSSSGGDGGGVVVQQGGSRGHTGCEESLIATATCTSAAEGSRILHGLIEELSALNQFVLSCKRELEAGRRQWMRMQGHRGR